MKKRAPGRPRGSSPKAKRLRDLVAAGVPAKEAAAQAGYADINRALQRQGKVAPEIRAVAEEAHAHLTTTTTAEVMSGTTVSALSRLTSIVAFGADRDAIAAARAIEVVAPEKQAERQAPPIFLTMDNGRGVHSTGLRVQISSKADEARACQLIADAWMRSDFAGGGAIFVEWLDSPEPEPEQTPAPTSEPPPEPEPQPPATRPTIPARPKRKPTKSVLQMLEELAQK